MRWLLPMLAACTTNIAEMASPCAPLEGQMFETRTALECGLGPNGPQTCPWHLSFDIDDTYHWQYSDIGNDMGHVTCSGNNVKSTMYSGTFDAAAGTVMWQGQLYYKID